MIGFPVGLRDRLQPETAALHRREVERVTSEVQIRGTRSRGRRALQLGDSGGEADAIFLGFLEDVRQLFLGHVVFHQDGWRRR